jgi:Xaa-Pro aminopeptidase
MRPFAWLPVLFACAAGLAAPLPEYATRRAKLRKALPDSVIVLIGRTERDTGDLRNGFFQEPNFYYLTGWREPGAALILTPGGETLFVPKRNPQAERWTGRKLAPDDGDTAARTGFDRVLPAESLETEFRSAMEQHARIYTVAGMPAADRLRQLAPLRDILDASRAIGRLRMVKSEEELNLIREATEASMAAHRAAWRRIGPGLYEYQVASTMTSAYFDRGCERSAYTPIVGSGPNSVVLHYSLNTRRMDSGEVLLMDVGAECSGYASDITRTVPVNGRFSDRQREIYDIVLGAQKAAIAALKPGMTLGRTTPNSLFKVAYDYLNTHGKDKHGEPLGKYFTHGLGHHVGLDVHDPEDPAVPLAEGMVVTIEPGIYIPEENLGIRIEDVVLVTKDGAQVLSAALPREAAEVEKAVAK